MKGTATVALPCEVNEESAHHHDQHHRRTSSCILANIIADDCRPGAKAGLGAVYIGSLNVDDIPTGCLRKVDGSAEWLKTVFSQ